MSKKRLLEKLSAEFPLTVHTEWHVSIETENGPHDIYFNNRGGIKLKACGSTETWSIFESELFKELRKYDYSKTDLAYMQSLTKFIGEVTGKEGIFVDAGWKNGRAKVAIINSKKNGDMEITVRNIEIETNIAAERWAIDKAAEIYYYGTIYSDCQPAANAHPRAMWIPRGQNKQADAIGNMRGKN